MELKRVSDRFPIWEADARGHLTEERRDQLLQLAEKGIPHSLTGDSSTSRGADLGDDKIHEVFVVDGDEVAGQLDWLVQLYGHEFLTLANATSVGSEFTVSPLSQSAVNVHLLEPGQAYEWHVDSNPLTAILFCTTSGPRDGGALVFRPDPRTGVEEEWEVAVAPEAGKLLLFDGRLVAHTAAEVRGLNARVTTAMNYYLQDQPLDRAPDLDTYLFEV